VLIVVEENTSYNKVIGSPSAPYLNSLAQQGALFTESFALRHPSNPNYIALFSGSMQGVTSDSCPHAFGAENLGSELINAGFTFAGYSESMPSVGFEGCASGPYTRHHNPWVDFTNLPPTVNLPFTDFPSDFNALPTVAFVIPNKNNDMHDGSIQQGDAWLRDNLGGYVRWAQTNNSLLIFTWDEADTGGPNHIVTVFAGPMVQAGSYCGEINHYNVLRTIEEMYGLPLLGESATVEPIANIWKGINSPPGVALTNLTDGEIFTAPVSIPLDAQATTSVGSISKVEFFSGNTKLGESSQEPFSLVLSNAPIGTYCLNVIATDDRGEAASSSPIEISVLTVEARLAQAQGDYAALFYNDDFVAVESSGFLSLKMKATGKFSAKISIAGKNYSFTGHFDSEGNSTNTILRRGLNSLTATLHLDLANDANALSGEITDGAWTAHLSGSRAFFGSKSNPAPQWRQLHGPVSCRYEFCCSSNRRWFWRGDRERVRQSWAERKFGRWLQDFANDVYFESGDVAGLRLPLQRRRFFSGLDSIHERADVRFERRVDLDKTGKRVSEDFAARFDE
jgi:acid phosphatase